MRLSAEMRAKVSARFCGRHQTDEGRRAACRVSPAEVAGDEPAQGHRRSACLGAQAQIVRGEGETRLGAGQGLGRRQERGLEGVHQPGPGGDGGAVGLQPLQHRLHRLLLELALLGETERRLREGEGVRIEPGEPGERRLGGLARGQLVLGDGVEGGGHPLFQLGDQAGDVAGQALELELVAVAAGDQHEQGVAIDLVPVGRDRRLRQLAEQGPEAGLEVRVGGGTGGVQRRTG